MEDNNYYIKLFYCFLIANGVFEKFCQNLINEGYTFQKWEDEILCGGHPSEWIDGSLYWEGTPQGHEFWFKLNRKWTIIAIAKQLYLKRPQIYVETLLNIHIKKQ